MAQTDPHGAHGPSIFKAERLPEVRLFQRDEITSNGEILSPDEPRYTIEPDPYY